MTAKHKPATALPWSVDQTPSGFEVVNEETLFTVARIPTSQRSMSTRMMETNAAYIVHAANAYPKLVEAIKDSLHGHCDVGSQSSALFLRILRELGEAE